MRRVLRKLRNEINHWRERVSWKIRRGRTARRMQLPEPLPPQLSDRDAILIFMPYAGVGPLFAAACVVARTLRERGHRVLVTRCYQLFERCPVMDMRQLPYPPSAEDKQEACLQCADNSLSMAESYGLECVDLRRLITPEIRERVQQAMERAPERLLDFEFDAQPIGKLGAVDLALAWKVSNLDDVSPMIRNAWLQYIESSLVAYLMVDQVCRLYPIRQLLHVNDYGMTVAGMLAARKYDVASQGMSLASHRNVDFRRYMFWPEVWKPSSFWQLDAWKECRELALSPECVREITEDEIVRLGGVGSHIYSPAKSSESRDPRPGWGLASDRKLLVAYTSSLDEAVAMRMGIDALKLTVPERSQPFANQIEWLRALADYVAASDHLQLVVRVHPREGATKHSKIESQHLQMLRGAFREPPGHCRFVWPEERISSYDLAEAADLALTSWSTIGLEVARLGVPVLAAFNGSWAAMPQDDFLEWGAAPTEYFQRLEMLLEAPVTLDRIVRAYRWYNLYHLGTSFDLGDIVPASTFNALPDYRVPAEAAAIEEIVVHQRKACDINVARLRAAQQPDTATIEAEELKRQLRRLVHFLLTGVDSRDDLPMCVFMGDGGKTTQNPLMPSEGGMRQLAIDGANVRYSTRELSTVTPCTRFSPMIARLAPLCATQIVETTTSERTQGTHISSER